MKPSLEFPSSSLLIGCLRWKAHWLNFGSSLLMRMSFSGEGHDHKPSYRVHLEASHDGSVNIASNIFDCVLRVTATTSCYWRSERGAIEMIEKQINYCDFLFLSNSWSNLAYRLYISQRKTRLLSQQGQSGVECCFAGKSILFKELVKHINSLASRLLF